MKIEPLGGEFLVNSDPETILAIVNKIDELVRESNFQDGRLARLESGEEDEDLVEFRYNKEQAKRFLAANALEEK